MPPPKYKAPPILNPPPVGVWNFSQITSPHFLSPSKGPTKYAQGEVCMSKFLKLLSRWKTIVKKIWYTEIKSTNILVGFIVMSAQSASNFRWWWRFCGEWSRDLALGWEQWGYGFMLLLLFWVPLEPLGATQATEAPARPLVSYYPDKREQQYTDGQFRFVGVFISGKDAMVVCFLFQPE